MRKTLSISYSAILLLATTYVLLDAFVLESRYQTVSSNVAAASKTTTTATSSDTSINIKTYRQHDTTIHVADITLDEE